MTLSNMNDVFKDMYPQGGERIKQWVVDTQREDAWQRSTCPRVNVSEHDDNTGMDCRNVGSTLWFHLNHDCCIVCNVVMDATRDRADVVAWWAEKAKRPPITQDRTTYSNEVQPDISMSDHPLFRILKR